MSQFNKNFGDTMYTPSTVQPSAPVIESILQSSAYSKVEIDALRENQLKNVCQTYQISEQFANRLKGLEGFEIVIVCDDSGSMITPTKNIDPSGRPITRWDELKSVTSIIVDIAATMDRNGVDVYFLNRPPITNITHHSQLNSAFAKRPKGGTGIAHILRSIFAVKRDTPRLVVLATDGQPTDVNGYVNIPEFRNVLEFERTFNDYITILACIDDDAVIGYLNGWDKELPRLDVVDDYSSERGEILAVQGSNFPFSFGDYVVKCLMGSIDSWFDKLDEINIYTSQPANTNPHTPIITYNNAPQPSYYHNDPVILTESNRSNTNSSLNYNSDFTGIKNIDKELTKKQLKKLKKKKDCIIL